jgi:hypothetical protein
LINYDSSFIYDDPLIKYDGTQTVQVTATAPLGAISSSATSVVKKVAQAQALLGALTATAQITPPQPEQKYGSRYGYYQVKNKKKPEPVEIKPTIIDYKFEPLEPLVKTIFATVQSDLFGLSSMAQSRIDFSTEQDDLDLLMIL